MLGYLTVGLDAILRKGAARLSSASSLKVASILALSVGVALAIASYVRGAVPREISTQLGLDPRIKTETELTYWLPPRDLRLEVVADRKLDIYVVDQCERVIAVENSVKQCLIKLHIPVRGLYKIKLVAHTKQPVTVNIYLTLFGVENDLLIISALTMTIGLFLAVYIILTRKSV